MSTIEQKPLAKQDPVPGRAGRAAAGLGIAALIASLGITGWSANYAMHIPDDPTRPLSSPYFRADALKIPRTTPRRAVPAVALADQEHRLLRFP